MRLSEKKMHFNNQTGCKSLETELSDYFRMSVLNEGHQGLSGTQSVSWLQATDTILGKVKKVFVHLFIWQVEQKLPVKASGPPECGVDRVESVCSTDDHYLPPAVQTIHQRQ